MHEQSVIRSLLRQVDAIRQTHGSRHVTEIRVEVGPLSGVEPLLLANAFEQLAPTAHAGEAKLVIDEIALAARCRSCEHEFDLSGFVFRCPHCGNSVRVTRGEEIQLISVSLEVDEPRKEDGSAEEIAT